MAINKKTLYSIGFFFLISLLAIFFPEASKKDILSIASQILTSEQSRSVVLSEKTGLVSVKRVVDGDTLVVIMGDKNETVRLIGINTPETVDPRKPVECFGKEAKSYLISLVAGKLVRLEADPTQQDRDKYRRLLRYIFLEDGTLINKILIQNGYAYEYTYDVPYQYQVEFRQAEKNASNAGIGLWNPSTCAGKK